MTDPRRILLSCLALPLALASANAQAPRALDAHSPIILDVDASTITRRLISARERSRYRQARSRWYFPSGFLVITARRGR